MTTVFFPLSVHPAVVIRQRKSYRRKDGVFLYFEDNAGVIVNNKGEMKGKKESTSLFSFWDLMIQLKKCARKGPFELMCRFILLCRFCHHRTSRKGMCRLVAQDCIQCWQHCMILWCVCKKNKNYLLPKKKKKSPTFHPCHFTVRFVALLSP